MMRVTFQKFYRDEDGLETDVAAAMFVRPDQFTPENAEKMSAWFDGMVKEFGADFKEMSVEDAKKYLADKDEDGGEDEE